MSTALSVQSDQIPALSREPDLSASLMHIIDRLTDGDDPYRHHIVIGAQDAIEANARLREIAHMCRPAPLLLISLWCKKLVLHLAKAPGSERDFDRAMEGVLLACGDLPFAVWTTETVGCALKTLKWWPAPAQIREILLPFAAPLWRLKNGLDCVVRMSGNAAIPGRPAEPTANAQEAVSAMVSSFVAERSFNQPSTVTKDPTKVQPAYLSDGALLAVWEKAAEDGLPGAEERVARLKQQFSKADDTR